MSKKAKKRILLTVKLIIAAVLLTWVFSKAHWNDYVQARAEYGGKTWTYLPRVTGGKQYVARWAYLPKVTKGKQDAYVFPWRKEVKVFKPEEYLPVTEGGDQFVRRGIAGSIEQMNLPLFVLAVLGFPISLLIVAYRFWFLLKSQGVHITVWEAVRLTFLGQFFNMVVPGTVGGDLVKAWYVSKHTHRTAGVLVTIFIDRVIGLIELVLMAGIMLVVVLGCGLETFERMSGSAITVAVVAGLCIGLMVFLLSSQFRKALHLQKLYRRLPIAHHIAAAGKSIRLYRRRPRVLVWALLFTLISHVFFIGAIALLGVALYLNTPLYNYFIYLPLIYIIGAIPVTPGGVGLIEQLYLQFFGVAAVGLVAPDASTIIALAMFARIIPMLWGMPGLLVAITGPRLPKADQMQAELDAEKQREEQAVQD